MVVTKLEKYNSHLYLLIGRFPFICHNRIRGPVKYHVGRNEVSWMQPRFYNCRTNCLTTNIRGPLVAVKCRQSVTLLECRLKSLYIWVFYTMYCTLILADNVQVTIVSWLCRHCLLRETTWTMRFSNFIQFSKLVLINVFQILIPIF